MPLDRPLAAALLAAVLPSGLFGLGVATAPKPIPEPMSAPVEDRWIDLLLANAPPRRPLDRTHMPDPMPRHRVACAYPRRGGPAGEPGESTFTTGGRDGGVVIGPIERSVVDGVVESAAPRLLRCIRAIPRPLRRFNLRLNVTDRGAVDLARVEGDAGLTDDVRSCMVGVLEGLRFPAHPGQGVTLVRYPLEPDLLDDGFRDRSFPGTGFEL